MIAVDRTVTQHRLKVHVHIDDHLQTASIEVRGTVTVANLRALYVIARRTSALLPGREIVIDLTHARAATDAVSVLHDPAQLNSLAITSGNKGLLCPLRILDPPHMHGSHPAEAAAAHPLHGEQKRRQPKGRPFKRQEKV